MAAEDHKKFILFSVTWGLLVLSAIACLAAAGNIALWNKAYLEASIIGAIGLALLWKQYRFAAKHDFHSIGRAERKFFLACFVAFSFVIVALLIWWFGQPDRPIPSQFGQAALRVRQALPALLVAVGALIVGWLGCHVICLLLRRGLHRARFNQLINQWTLREEKARAIDFELWTSRSVYYLLMLLVLVVFFQLLGLSTLAEPLNRLLEQIARFLPRVLGAGLLLLFAGVLATVLRMVIARSLTAVGFDNHIGGEIPRRAQSFSAGDSVAATVYWLVLLLFLPAVLSALHLPGLTAPIQAMLRKALAFFPNIITAALILAVGWFVARALQRIVSGLLASAGADVLSDRAGLAPVLGPQGFSNAIGVVLYTLILIPVLIAALNALDLEALSQPASNMLNTLLTAFPAILAATMVLTLAYVVGRVIAGLITDFLTSIGLNAMLPQMGRGNAAAAGKNPSEVIGFLVLVAVMLIAAVEAANQLGFALLAELIAGFIVFAGQVTLGLIILGIGLYLADVASKTLRASGTQQAGLLATSAKISIVILSGAMALRQMGLGSEIIQIAFGLLFGAVVVALAIALGLGSQEIAARHLDQWIQSIRPKKPQQNKR